MYVSWFYSLKFLFGSHEFVDFFVVVVVCPYVCDDGHFDMFVATPWLHLGPTCPRLSVLGSDKPPEKVSEKEG